MGGHESHYISIYYHQLDVYEYIIWSGTYMYECFVWFCAPFYIWHLQLGIYAWCSSYGWVLVVFQFQGVVCMAVNDVCLTTIAILTRVTYNGLFFPCVELVVSWCSFGAYCPACLAVEAHWCLYSCVYTHIYIVQASFSSSSQLCCTACLDVSAAKW